MPPPPPPSRPKGFTPDEEQDTDPDSLSLPATLLYRLGLPLTTGALYYLSPPTALFVPLVAAPTALLLHQRARFPPRSRPARLEPLIWTFLGAATVMPAVSIAVQSALSYGTALLVFGERTAEYVAEFTRAPDAVRGASAELVAKRAGMARSAPYLAYLTFFSFAMAGLPEELCKYGILRFLRRRSGPLTAREHILYARVIGLGFSFFENLGYIYVAATKESRNMLLVTAAERILYGTAAHVLTAVLTATLMARDADGRGERQERKSWWQIVGPSTLYHGAGNALLLAACAWDGHPGWVHPETLGTFLKYMIGPVALMTGLGMQVAREMKKLGVRWRFD